MSYDISSWRTKQLEGLVIPLKAFTKHARDDWHPTFEITPESEITVQCGCGQEIKGKLKDGAVLVESLDMSGEGSGTFYNWIFEPALQESKGTLEAVLIWEGGDSISRLKSIDGQVSSEDVEL